MKFYYLILCGNPCISVSESLQLRKVGIRARPLIDWLIDWLTDWCMGTADPRMPPYTGSMKKNREKIGYMLTLRVNLIPLPDSVDNWNPKILDLADKFITVDYSAFICLSGNLWNQPVSVCSSSLWQNCSLTIGVPIELFIFKKKTFIIEILKYIQT